MLLQSITPMLQRRGNVNPNRRVPGHRSACCTDSRSRRPHASPSLTHVSQLRDAPSRHRARVLRSSSRRGEESQRSGNESIGGGVDESWWGKERTLRWEENVLSLSLTPPWVLPNGAPSEDASDKDDDRQLIAMPGSHPVGHVYWRCPSSDSVESSSGSNSRPGEHSLGVIESTAHREANCGAAGEAVTKHIREAGDDSITTPPNNRRQARRAPSVARVNSAGAAMELKWLRWERVWQLAQDLEARDGNDDEEEPIVDVYWGHGPLPTVADLGSLETCLAAALVDTTVELRVVLMPSHQSNSDGGITDPEEPSAMSTPAGASGHAQAKDAAARERRMEAVVGSSINDGWEASGNRSASRVELLFNPGVLMCSRDTELACWPKVWQFAQMLREGSEAAESLGAVDAAWCPRQARWTVSNRHRALAAALVSQPLRCVVSLPQHLGLPGGNEGPSRVWRGPPSQTRLKRARKASEALLTALNEANVASGDIEKAIKVCQQALQKAPEESMAAGVTRKQVALLRARLASVSQDASIDER